jgi:putative ABC transport system permease protein
VGTWIKIAFRNILKNRRRSLATLLAIGIGFAALSLFRGYTHNVYSGLRRSAINGEGLGHLTIYKHGWLDKGRIDPVPYMFSPQELRTLLGVVEADADVVLATPQLYISGLVSNGRISMIFLAKGVIPRDERTIIGAWEIRRALQGPGLHDQQRAGVEMAQELARTLELPLGGHGVVMAATLDGQVNALDIDVRGIYDTGTAATNDKFMRVPLALAQALYDTEQADRVVVLLDDWQKTAQARTRLLHTLAAAGLEVDIHTWQELSLSYARIETLFDMIFLFISTIVLVIVGMSVVNTMSMAVVERTREIGTLRALGLQRRGVSLLFATEGTILGVLGIMLGLAISIAVWAVIAALAPTYTPPSASTPVPLLVSLVPEILARSAMLLVSLALLAAFLPARHAAKQNVVEALGHV